MYLNLIGRKLLKKVYLWDIIKKSLSYGRGDVMKKAVMWGMVVLLSFAIAGCSKCEHEYDNGVITKEPTCTEEGEKTFTCSLCEKTKIESVAKTSHIYVEKVTKEPTCTEEGETILTCSLCEETKLGSVAKKPHTYAEEITKEPTFEEEGEKTFTCKNCSDSYTESIPVRDDKVVVTVTGKSNLPKDTNAGRYSDRVQLTFDVMNRSDNVIKGVQGNLTVYDLFGEEILEINCDFTGSSIPIGESITVEGLGMEINPFIDRHVKFYNTDFPDLQFGYEVTDIVYDDGSSMKEQSSTGALESQKVAVNVTDKRNLDINYNVGRYSPRVEFLFEVYNYTSKDIRGVQGLLTIKDLFGVDITSFSLDFTGQTIGANSSVTISGMGIEINRFMDDHVKIYNTNLEDLKFEYKVASIVYSDGTTE